MHARAIPLSPSPKVFLTTHTNSCSPRLLLQRFVVVNKMPDCGYGPADANFLYSLSGTRYGLMIQQPAAGRWGARTSAESSLSQMLYRLHSCAAWDPAAGVLRRLSSFPSGLSQGLSVDESARGESAAMSTSSTSIAGGERQ